jgi:hypothetical protein
MNEMLRRSITEAWHKLPKDARSEPATEEQLRQFESTFGAIPEDFRWFLATCGGGLVGADRVDDITQLPESHLNFRCASGPHRWTMDGVFIVGWDGGGNPFGIELSTGRVLVEYQNGIHRMASSFAAFLLQGL